MPMPPQREQQALPLPPPPMPPPPATRQAERLPGLFLPGLPQLTPETPPRQAQPRPQGLRGMDLSLGPSVGRMTPEPELEVRGAEVGPDWRNAFHRWIREHWRYPQAAAVLGQEGMSRVRMTVSPDGRVLGVTLVTPSGSIWLDATSVSLFRGATIPPFPPGADPRGVTIDLRMHYVLIRR
jgi:TonB family protein